VRLPQFHLRTLTVAIGIVAALFADLRVNVSWWAVKPALYLVFIPLVSATLAARSPRRGFVVLVAAMNALLLLGWFELRRPEEGFVCGWRNSEHVLDGIQDCCRLSPDDAIRAALNWIAWRGTMPDMLCLVGSMLILLAILGRSVSCRSRILWAMSLTVLSIYGWATSKRWGGTDDSQDWLTYFPWYGGDKTPIHLSQRWLHEGGGLPRIWSAIGAVRASEFAVLATVLVSLTAVALHAILQRRTVVSPLR
jgi:hypothetical protein